MNTMEYVRNHTLHNWIVHAAFKRPGKNKNLSSYQVTLNKLNLISSAPSVNSVLSRSWVLVLLENYR